MWKGFPLRYVLEKVTGDYLTLQLPGVVGKNWGQQKTNQKL